MAVVLNINLSGMDRARAALDAVRNNGTALAPAFKAAGLLVMESVNRNFMEGGRPDKWQPLAPSTIRRRKGSGSPEPLRDTGLLMGSIGRPAGGGVYELRPLSLRIGTNVPYAGAHNEGKGVPKREFMLLQAEDEENINKVFADHMAKGTGA